MILFQVHHQTISKEATQDSRTMPAYTVNNEDILLLIVPHGFQDLEILVLLEQIRETVLMILSINI